MSKPIPTLADLCVIVPAHNEAETIGACLSAVFDATGPARVQVIVVANGCTDATADIARGFDGRAKGKGWSLEVLELAEGGKLGALNAGEAAARARALAYLDADVLVSPDLFQQTADALNSDTPAYASGALRFAPARSFATRAYARIYAQVPFITHGVPGAGYFAMNAAGRARWSAWPDIISDDTFARLSFAPGERVGVAASYQWPLVEGWSALVKVRRRQNRGVAEIEAKYPELLRNDDKPSLPMGAKLAMALRDPVGFAIYAGVAVATKFKSGDGWERGR